MIENLSIQYTSLINIAAEDCRTLELALVMVHHFLPFRECVV